MPCYHTTLSDNNHLIVLTVIANHGLECQFLYQSNSWKLQLHESEKRGTLSLAHDVRGLGRSFVIKPFIKLYRGPDGVWTSRVLYKKEDEVLKVKEHGAKANSSLDCAAKTLRNIYGT